MSALSVPAEYRKGLEALAGLGLAEADRLIQAVADTSPRIRRRAFIREALAKLSQPDPNNFRPILDAVVVLPTVRDWTGRSSEQFVDDLANSDDLHIPEGQRPDFKKAVSRLMDCHSLIITSKAGDIYTDHERTLSDVRILSDIRPVFGFDRNSPPEAAIIVHSLKLHYVENQAHKDFYVALDSADLARLRRTVDHAERKAQQLAALVSNSQIPLMDVEES